MMKDERVFDSLGLVLKASPHTVWIKSWLIQCFMVK